MRSFDTIEPAEDVKEFSSFAADIDLITELGSARIIEIIDAGSGSLAVKMASNGGVTRVLTGLANGYKTPLGQFQTIVASGTDVAKVRVWA
jgi:hypothetical protein